MVSITIALACGFLKMSSIMESVVYTIGSLTVDSTVTVRLSTISREDFPIMISNVPLSTCQSLICTL